MLTKRTFASIDQAIKELYEGRNPAGDFEVIKAGGTVCLYSNKADKWIIFNKGIGSCRIETTTREVKLIRLSIKNVIAVHIPAGCGFALNAHSRVIYKVLNIDPKP